MATSQEFAELLTAILSRHQDTPLASRWEEAQSTDPNPIPDSFWIRESDDLVNVVWLTRRGVNDITWIPGLQMSTFNFLRLSSIVAIEMREAPEAAKALGVSVSGDFVVLVRSTGDRAGLVWVAADDPANVTQLRSFARDVVKKIAQD